MKIVESASPVSTLSCAESHEVQGKPMQETMLFEGHPRK